MVTVNIAGTVYTVAAYHNSISEPDVVIEDDGAKVAGGKIDQDRKLLLVDPAFQNCTKQSVQIIADLISLAWQRTMKEKLVASPSLKIWTPPPRALLLDQKLNHASRATRRTP